MGFERVYSIVLQPDGKVLTGGQFSSYNGTNIKNLARLNSDGSLDTSFNVGTGLGNNVFSIVLHQDGKVLIGGMFPIYNGEITNYMVRLLNENRTDYTCSVDTANSIAGLNTVYIRSSDTYGNVTLADYPYTQFNGPADITYTAGTNGTISGSTTQHVVYGTDGSEVTAVPDTGYHFVDWSDGRVDNPRIDTGVTSDISVVANFEIDMFTVRYLSELNGYVSGATTQVISYGGTTSAVTAVYFPGYDWWGWSDGIKTISRSDSNITSDKTVTAMYVKVGSTSPSIVTNISTSTTPTITDTEDEENTSTDDQNQNEGLTQIRIVDSEGNPIVGAVVEIEGKLYTSDENGYIYVEGLEDMKYEITITVDGKTHTKSVEISNGEGEVTITETNLWRIWLLLLLVTILTGYYIYRKRKKKD